MGRGDGELLPLPPGLCRGGRRAARHWGWMAAGLVVVAVVLQQQQILLSEHGRLWPPGAHLRGAGRGRLRPLLLGGLGDPGAAGRRGGLGVRPPWGRGGLLGACQTHLCPPLKGAGEGPGGAALWVVTPTVQAYLRALEAEAGDSGTGGAVDLLGGDLDGDLRASVGGRIGVPASR